MSHFELYHQRLALPPNPPPGEEGEAQEEEKEEGDIVFSHEFLLLADEASFEQQSLFSNPKNDTVIATSFAEVGFTPKGVRTTVVASIGSSSTQFYSAKGLLGAMYVGSGALLADPTLIPPTFSEIVKAMAQTNQLDAPLVLCNSIGFYVEKVTHLNALTPVNVHEFLKLGSPDQSTELVGAFLLALSNAAVAQNVQAFIFPQKAPLKLKNDWLSLKASAFAEKAPGSSFYMVDFGGGGIDVNFYDHVTGSLGAVGKDRKVYPNQDVFIQEILSSASLEGPDYPSVLSIKRSLRKLIMAHAMEHAVSQPLTCNIFQTGKARQMFFVGHCEAEPKNVVALAYAEAI